jgi:hypothetical protein
MQISQNESEPSGCDLPFVLNCFELAEIFLSKSELHKKRPSPKEFPFCEGRLPHMLRHCTAEFQSTVTLGC